MHTLIIYDTEYGNTQQIALALAEAFKVHGSVRLVVATETGETEMPDLQGVDLLVIGGPTQIHGLSPAMRILLKNIPTNTLSGLPVVTFDTRYRAATYISGSAAQAIAHELKKEKALLLLPPKSFFVRGREGPLEEDGEDNAARWVQTIMQRYDVYRAKHATV